MNERILYRQCPLCESSNIVDFKTANCSGHPLYNRALSPIMKWRECADCTHVFTEGYFTDEACALIFGKTHEHQRVGTDIERQRVISSHLVEKMLPYASSGTWLDVGFGNGSLLFTAQEYGFTPLGLDLRADNVALISSFGVEAYCQDLADLSLDTKCAVISMADVLEHAPFPKVTLRAAHELLAEEGMLFVSMPNQESTVWTALDEKEANPYWGEIEHYHNFGRTRLYSLLRETGFEPIRYGISERYRVCMEVIAKRI